MGKITASRFVDAIDRKKRCGSFTDKAWAYLFELVGELASGRPGDRFISKAMEAGTTREPIARAIYCTRHNREGIVHSAGFILHPDRPLYGGSPDMLIDDDGGLEIKCPQWNKHLRTVFQFRDVPSDNLPQVQGLMWITGRQWWDFMSFQPTLRIQNLAEFVVRSERDDDYIAEMVDKLGTFEAKLKEVLSDRVEDPDLLLYGDNLSGALASVGKGYDGTAEWSPDE